MSSRIVTVLEARVAPERAAALEEAYAALGGRGTPPGLLSSRLIRDVGDADLWRLETTWRDRAALEAMRGQGTPGGVLLFREVGVDPSLKIFEEVATISPAAT